MTTLAGRALKLAKTAHAGQVDKGGVPYIEHPLAVAAQVDGDIAKTVALLHDVLEDTPVTLAQLEQAGFPAEVIEAVRTLTKTKGAPYRQYLERVKCNDLARVVKLADLKHNMDANRLKKPLTEADEARLEKYRQAMVYLLT